MPKFRTIRLKIDRFTPHTLSMARLAEYLADFADLLGNKESVHFVRVAKGSADLVTEIEEKQLPEITARIHLIPTGDAPPEALRANYEINNKLRQDETAATLKVGRAKLFQFPGVNLLRPHEFGPVIEQGTLDGVLIKIGGRDETVPVHLEGEGERVYICNATRDIAKKLAPHLFGATLRVHGSGRWIRGEQGQWTLDRFNISNFETLDDAPLPVVIERLRAIPDNEWKNVADPLRELRRIRKGDRKVQ